MKIKIKINGKNQTIGSYIKISKSNIHREFERMLMIRKTIYLEYDEITSFDMGRENDGIPR